MVYASVTYAGPGTGGGGGGGIHRHDGGALAMPGVYASPFNILSMLPTSD